MLLTHLQYIYNVFVSIDITAELVPIVPLSFRLRFKYITKSKLNLGSKFTV